MSRCYSSPPCIRLPRAHISASCSWATRSCTDRESTAGASDSKVGLSVRSPMFTCTTCQVRALAHPTSTTWRRRASPMSELSRNWRQFEVYRQRGEVGFHRFCFCFVHGVVPSNRPPASPFQASFRQHAYEDVTASAVPQPRQGGSFLRIKATRRPLRMVHESVRMPPHFCIFRMCAEYF